ncbi:MAG: adenylate/guanylate cyclase domain-containing protein [Brevefilum sp.]|nr:adenylate/guanylate cyclase domain-containing protein [Brevefilum sp.]
MQCPECGYEISDRAIFCPNCGVQIKVICPECGASTQAGAAFCSQCGVRLPAQLGTDLLSPKKDKPQSVPFTDSFMNHIDPYERRNVTILFADIAGYSTISETIDPENLADIMRDAYPCLLEPIHKLGGMIVQVMGDGVLAYFGAPSALEDDPERAVLAGLEIVARVQTYAKKLQLAQILDGFHVRVGINTGLVVIGEMNPEKHLDYIAMGDAVNLASRLQQNAPEDGVLISHSTYQHVRGLFDVQQQAPLIVKGREGIEKTYLVERRRPDHLRIQKRGLDGVATTMIGREPEMAALKNIYQDAIQGGETSLILISGDPGIGKTRLVNEFAAWARSQNMSPILLRGRAITGTQDVPYGVLRYLFARSFGILETDTSAQALEKFRRGTENFIDTEQADLLGQLVGFDFKVSPYTRQVAELYLKSYMRSLAEKSLLIILEDLQWVDDQTLDFISELLLEYGGISDRKMMILCTARTQFFEARPKWGEGILGFRDLRLRRLSSLQSRSLIDEILFGAEDIPEAFYQCVIDEAGGNPFFIEEMIKMFFDEEVITTKDASLLIELERLKDLHVPSTLKGILQARLDSLPLAEKEVLQRAAIIGRTFWDGLLLALVEDKMEIEKINSMLEALRERGLIYHRERSSLAGHQEYLFKHALLRDEAYETVLIKNRCRFHKQVAKWIEENSGDRLEEHLALIANHYLEAGQKDLAADWFIKAGERALKVCSVQEATLLFEKALNLISDQDLIRLWQATLGHDEAVGTLGELDARHADDVSLLNIAKLLEDDGRLAEAYYRIGSQAYREGNNREAARTLDHALEVAIRTKDLMLQAQILPLKISILSEEGDLKAAGSLVEHSMALARQTGDADVLARALNNLAPYYQAIGDISKSVQFYQEQIEINRQQGNHLGETYGLLNLGYSYLSFGHFELGRKLLERALKIAQRLGSKTCEAYSLLNLGLAEWRLGRSEEAIEVLESSRDFLVALEDQRGLAYRQFYIGLSFEAAEDLSEAVNHFTSAINSFKNIGVTSGIVETQAGLARLAIQAGDISRAEQLALQVIHYLSQEGPQGLELPILAYLSCIKVFDALGDRDTVQQVLKQGLKEIEDQIAMIQDEDWKVAYRDNIPENRALIAFDR